MAKQRTVGLITFLKGTSNPADKMPGCASYDHYYGGCLFCNADCMVPKEVCEKCMDFMPYTYCRIQRNERCLYFEKAVLPTAIDIGLLDEMTSLYRKHVGLDEKPPNKSARKCPDCGANLRPKRRYCDNCRDRRNRESKRNWKNN